MNEIIYQKSYREYKEELDGELRKTAEGFVKIGYLLKVARDTNVLAGSGYASVVDFAKAEYGIDKTQVSRFISINDKFSEGGYSDRLISTYQGYGYAKLTLMLNIPEEITEELSPELSKSEIQIIKNEVEEEKKTTDIEIAMERAAAGSSELDLQTIVRQLGENEPELFKEIHAAYMSIGISEHSIKPIMAPDGEKIYTIRIQGIGRVMIALKDDDKISVTPIRTPEDKTFYEWSELAFEWYELMDDHPGTVGMAYRDAYGKELEEKPEVAPVQQEPKKEVKKQPKVVKSEPKQAKSPIPKQEPEAEKIKVTAEDVEPTEAAEMQCTEPILNEQNTVEIEPKTEKTDNFDQMNAPEEPKTEEEKTPEVAELQYEDANLPLEEKPAAGSLIYISGPITGTDDAAERFAAAAEHIRELGYIPVNPQYCVRLPEECTHDQWMIVDIAILSLCQGIYMLDRWTMSSGAKEEYEYATAHGMWKMLQSVEGKWIRKGEAK